MAWMDQIFGDVFLGNEEIQRSKDADAKLAEINDAALARGAVTQEQHDTTATNIANQSVENILSNPETSIYGGFQQGAVEGLQSDFDLAKRAATGLAGAIPWQGYVVGAVVVLFLINNAGFIPKRR